MIGTTSLVLMIRKCLSPISDWSRSLLSRQQSRTGGIYSTSSDLSRFLKAILNSELLDEATTNAWFKPHSWSSSMSGTFGMPWEIFRSNSLLPDTDRGVTIITKAGGLFAYVSHIVLVPEYGLGFTILVAGDGQALRWLDNEVITTVLKGVEYIARNQTSARYSGLYRSTKLNSSVTLEVGGGSGLTMSNWISNGTDFLAEYIRFETGKRDTTVGRVQLVPAKTVGSGQGQLWRATFVPDDLEPKGIIDTCMVNDVDSFIYGSRSLLDFEFVLDKDGKAKEVILPAFNITLQKRTRLTTPLLRNLGSWTWLQKALQGEGSPTFRDS